jgi:hypothetical protein
MAYTDVVRWLPEWTSHPHLRLILAALLGVLVSVGVGTILLSVRETEPIERIGDFILGTVSDVTEDEMHDLMVEHLQRMHFVNDEMEWASPELAAIEFFLLSETGPEDVRAFIDATEKHVGENEYLKLFLKRAVKDDRLDSFVETVRAQREEFPSIIAYAMVLDRLTRAMTSDYELLESSIQVLTRAADEARMLEYTYPSELEKLHLVEGFILGVVYAQRMGVFLPEFGSGELPANIMWAVDIDRHLGNEDNAEVGEMLTRYGPGYDGGPTARMSANGNIVLLTIPEPLRWMDLYATWNMAYVSHYTDFPMMVTKLLIPTVSDYRTEPEGYLHVRLIALYLHIYHQLLVRADTLRLDRWDADEIVWNDLYLTELWGKVNRESAREYERIMEAKAK